MAKKLQEEKIDKTPVNGGVDASYDPDLANVENLLAQETLGAQGYTAWKAQKDAEDDILNFKDKDGSIKSNGLYGKDVVSDTPSEEATEAPENPNANRKFELVQENTKQVDGRTLYQIRALEDIKTSEGLVKAGDLGGWVEKQENLDIHGNAWIDPTSNVYGDARVQDNAFVGRGSTVKDNAIVKDNASVLGPQINERETGRGIERVIIPDPDRDAGERFVDGSGFDYRTGTRQTLGYEVPADREGPVIANHAIVEDQSRVRAYATVDEFARMTGDSKATGVSHITENATMAGKSVAYDNSYVGGATFVSENAKLYDNSRADENSYVAGDAELRGNSHVGGMTELRDKANDFLGLDDITLGGNAELADAQKTVYDSQHDVNRKNFEDGWNKMVDGVKTFATGLATKFKEGQAGAENSALDVRNSRVEQATSKFSDVLDSVNKPQQKSDVLEK